MTAAPKTRWMTMLNQARGFMEHDPHGALGRVDEVLRDIETHLAAHPSAGTEARDTRTDAQALRRECERAYARFQADAAKRSVAYRDRIQREIAGGGQH